VLDGFENPAAELALGGERCWSSLPYLLGNDAQVLEQSQAIVDRDGLGQSAVRYSIGHDSVVLDRDPRWCNPAEIPRMFALPAPTNDYVVPFTHELEHVELDIRKPREQNLNRVSVLSREGLRAERGKALEGPVVRNFFVQYTNEFLVGHIDTLLGFVVTQETATTAREQ
jgi:hypothetical protein